MGSVERVDLARQADVIIGRLSVSPARRELTRDDGVREVLEHRVMQVLIALHRADGGIVTRDELTRSCWEGRIVGDDAINRVISRLRKVADGIGAGSFAIETITKIGYRLASSGFEAASPASEAGDAALSPALRPTRRGFALGGAALGVTALAGGGAWLYRRAARPAVPPEVERLMGRGWTMMLQGNRDAQIEAAGLFRRAVELAPDYADGWGSLGFVYAYSSHYYPAAEREARRDRARAAATRALAIDRGNGMGRAALAFAQPWRGHWLEIERTLRAAGRDHPEDDLFRTTLGYILGMVGRFAEAAQILDRMGGSKGERTLEPGEYYYLIESLWAAGRLEDADRRIAEATALYPTEPNMFFLRYQIWLFSGRAGAAAALIANRSGRPTGIDQGDWDRLGRIAHLFESPAPDEVARFAADEMERARTGNGVAGSVLENFAELGLIDEAFALADALFFGRGFTVPDQDAPGAPYYHALEDRETSILFAPSTRALRADPRFNRLVEQLGLERYWRAAGVQPDYRRT
ncbi:hypothetical protein CVO77_01390 [Sphingopyxis lindanitolerans]|uniref:OmpR/PhoB-type domain-containing protein n=1 Tax=Sphingopyxis lindanitolerans TaxID=2054227 RepID=A0A2S8BB89_9SPHN|nr:winged helix-turn-helix domain-containing protein [Sphingopyxis lindanitolerans]PQM29593.1 hypothetical protein CVO77_01390 [Sphingopyxis lindanitolerans]